MLSKSPLDQHRILWSCRGDIIAEDHEHAFELRGIIERPTRGPRVMVAGG